LQNKKPTAGSAVGFKIIVNEIKTRLPRREVAARL
jgi:hypothetical protein